MSRTPLLCLFIHRMLILFWSIFLVNIPYLYEKWFIKHEILSNKFVFGLPQRLELIALAVFLISHYVSGPWVRFALLASIQINLNMSESLHHLCDHPCVHCLLFITYLPLYVFHCFKIDSVQIRKAKNT